MELSALEHLNDRSFHFSRLLSYPFYAPNFEKVGSILLSACPSVRPFVRLFVRPFKKNLKLGF